MKNGKTQDDDKDKERVIHFPTLAERDRLRREKRETEEKTKKSAAPFFNTGRIPPLTGFIVLNFLAIHVALLFLFDGSERWILFNTYGFVPGVYTGAAAWHWQGFITPLTHMFLHGGWMHLLFNGVMMVAMGTFMERLLGMRRMLFFFFASGLCGAALYFVLNPFTVAPVIGASGAISGLFAVTFLNLYEQGSLGPVGRRGPLALVLFWIALMAGMGLIQGDIAWQAHLGGFLGGLGLFYALRKGLIRL